MTNIILIALIAVLLTIYFILKSAGKRKESAISNAINAKITYHNLPDEKKEVVNTTAKLLYASGTGEKTPNAKYINLNSISEFERFFLYSYAMIAMGIAPIIEAEKWKYPPRNPFALSITKNELNRGTVQFERTYQVYVYMDH